MENLDFGKFVLGVIENSISAKFALGALGALAIQVFRIAEIRRLGKEYKSDMSASWPFVTLMTLVGGLTACFVRVVMFGSEYGGAFVVGLHYDRVMTLLTQKLTKQNLEQRLCQTPEASQEESDDSRGLVGHRASEKHWEKLRFRDYMSLC